MGLHVVGRDITERRRAEEHQLLLINELNHRVKNTLAVVQSITHQTLRQSNADPDTRHRLEGRIAALSAAHDVLTRENWSAASIREITANAVSPFCSEERCTLEGPDLRLNPQTAVNLALAVHELCTNAVKYGALSNETGRIIVRWGVDDGEFEFIWKEEGGPKVTAPPHRGFGSRMIQRGLPGELSGTGEMEFREEGLLFRLRAPAPASGEAPASP